MSERCYPISTDAADILAKFFGIQKNKIAIRSLGVDTDLFKPVSDEVSRQRRSKIRKELGFSDSDIVCVYTGRFESCKNPLCLAHAIKKLAAIGEPFRGLFIGCGSEVNRDKISDSSCCITHPFVPVKELPKFYQAGDIAVWPKQESTSQLDAAACGLPLILSDKVKVKERIEGNGLTYREDDIEDMIRQLLVLRDPVLRQKMGACGADKMRRSFSWHNIAKEYATDYEDALRKTG